MGGKRRRDGEADVASRHAALTRWLRAQGAEMRGLMIRTAPGGGSALYAHTDFSVGQSIGGLPTLAILDPLSVLHRDPVALSALARGATEPFAFWLALAVMATDHTAHFYAYLMACPQEAPEPCAWPAEDRRLLEGTPLAAQVEAQRKLLAEEYSRIAPHVAPSVPFDVNGVGAYPSLLWARGVHMSRCFPRALVEAAVLKTPHEILASDMLDAPLRVELGGSQPATFAWSGNAAPKPGAATDGQRMLVASAAKVGADVAAGTGDREATESGGSGEPMCNASTGPPARQVIPHCAEPAEQPRYNSGEANCLAGTLGALLPGLDMMDHASGHPIGWEAGGGTVRFRCRVPVAAGEPLYNNYGPKGNAELLFTYGFALMDNPMDTVEGIWVACSPAVASCAGEKGEEDGENGAHSTTSGAALMAARVELLEEYDVPYVTKEDGTLLMGPFELKSPPQGAAIDAHASEAVREAVSGRGIDGARGREAGAGGDDIEEDGDAEDSVGVLPAGLLFALQVIGMDDIDAGPTLTLDELDLLSITLQRRLEGLLASEAADQETTPFSRPHFVAAYRNGQRKLLRSALSSVAQLAGEGAEPDDEN